MSAPKKKKAAKKAPVFIIWYTPPFWGISDGVKHEGWRSADGVTTGVFRTRAAANAAIRAHIAVCYVGRPEARSRFSVRELGGEK